jgi:hypothetical protein
MTNNEAMARIGACTSFPTRLTFCFFGLLALFFPGYVVCTAFKAMGIVLDRLTTEERLAFASLLVNGET